MANLLDKDRYLEWAENPVTVNVFAQIKELRDAMLVSQFGQETDERYRLSLKAEGVQEIIDLMNLRLFEKELIK